MPVPSGGLKAYVTLWCEVAFVGPHQTHSEEDRADHNVEAVEPSRHKEVGAVNVARKTEGRVAVLISLEKCEQNAQQNRAPQALFQRITIIVMCNRVVRPSGQTARTQQDQRVDQRQMPRVKGFDPNGWPNTINDGRAFCHWVECVFKERPEPSDEEHHFGHDEHNHAVAQTNHHDRCVIANMGLVHNFGPPCEHRVQNHYKPDQHDPRE